MGVRLKKEKQKSIKEERQREREERQTKVGKTLRTGRKTARTGRKLSQREERRKTERTGKKTKAKGGKNKGRRDKWKRCSTRVCTSAVRSIEETASDLLLSTAAYEELRGNVQMYIHDSSLDEELHFADEEKTEYFSVYKYSALVELMS
ncbi:hypothetical protein NPIL_449471 [Nephila pilipes]|uniref:Uncharacterized protein n=1 Tax=Nephila pilipes TaxID=299642 RepID=A0A8X6QM30_NEPPI|nr:hypothetical protein NPIL_449471 [Nephila pilipes]